MKLQLDSAVRVHAALIFSALVWAAMADDPRILGVLGPVAFARRIHAQRAAWWHDGFGLPNAITVARLAITASLAFIPPAYCPWVAPLTIAIFALDGLDGWLARELGRTSEFGAALDMEVDAYLIAVLCCGLWHAGIAGVWILLPGALRYLWVFAVALVGHEVEAPRSRFTRYAFSILVCSLATAFLPLGAFSTFAALLGTATVCISFGQAFWKLLGPQRSS